MFTGRKQMLKKVKPEIQVSRPEQESKARKLLKLSVQGKKPLRLHNLRINP